MLTDEQKTHVIILSCIYTGTGSLGFLANLVQMIFICRDKKQRNSIFGMTLFSLSTSDIFVSILQLYRGSLCILLLLVIDISLTNKVGTPTDLGISFSLAASFFHVIFIAVMRLLALVFPLRIKCIITKSRCKLILLLLWLLAIAFVTIYYFIIKGKLGAILIIITSVILLVAYSFICYRMKGRYDIDNNDATRRYRQQSDRDVLVYSMALAFTFCICYMPASMSHFMKMSPRMQEIAIFLYSVNPFLDPLLYFFASHCKRRREKNHLQKGNNTNGSLQTIKETSRI